MSKILYVISRKKIENKTKLVSKYCSQYYNGFNNRIISEGNYLVALFNASETSINKGCSWLLGVLYESCNNWYQPKSYYPDGSFAIFRQDDSFFEAVSDAAASRTIWYYFDDEQLVVSTSQRAIVSYLQSFEFNELVIPWMLSTGSLGPYLSWDKRINSIKPDSSLLLDKNKWTIQLCNNEIEFNSLGIDNKNEGYQDRLEHKIREVLNSLSDLDRTKWKIPLSGGYDCRGLICNLSGEKFDAITWGSKGVINHKLSDRNIAESVAKQLGIDHHYFEINDNNLSISEILDKIFDCGEGRIDHISGYMDGMGLWESLYKQGVNGLIRGDEGFGWLDVYTPYDVRASVGCNLCSDYSNLKNVIENFGFEPQNLPKEYERKSNESLETWRDRLYHMFRLPIVLAALSDFKYTYLEQINPFLSSKLLNEVRQQPDIIRNNKITFKKIVEKTSPSIPFARYSSTKELSNVFYDKEVIDEIKMALDTHEARELLGDDFINYIISGIKNNKNYSKNRSNFLSLLKKGCPKFIKKSYKKNSHHLPMLDGNLLAFRVYTLVKMNCVLNSFRADIRKY